MAYGSTITTRDLAFPLLVSLVHARSQVLDSLKRFLAITTFGSLGRLVHALRHELTTGCSHGSDLVRLGVVGVARITGPAAVRHGESV
jgi:hypothetical protein